MNVLSNIFSKNKLSKNTLNMLPDATLVITSDGEIKQSNKKAQDLFGLSENELKKTNISNLIEGAVLVIDSILSTGKVQTGKSVIDGNRLIYLEINAKMNVETENDNLIVVSLRDVTDVYIQNAEMFSELEDLKGCSADKNEFLINISNELQAPLHSAAGFSQALLENLGGELNDKQQKYISIINKNSNELLSLFSKIVTLSKFEKNSINIEQKNFDLIELINGVIAAQKNIAQGKNLTFTLNSEELVRRNCYIDENLIKTLFTNLLEPIVKNSSSDNITIQLSHPTKEFCENSKLGATDIVDEKSFVIINVLINNFSVTPNELDLIMDPYAQAKRENKKYLDTALSFAIARKITQFLSGGISISPKGVQGADILLIIKLDRAETK